MATMIALLAAHAVAAAATPAMQVYLAASSTADEAFAAQELSELLGNATGSAVAVGSSKASSGLTLAVGYGAATAVGLPSSALDNLGNESFVVTSNASGVSSGCIAISGGQKARRGALYGVYHLLDAWGFRFFAPNATVMPTAAAIAAAAALPIDAHYGPHMELRSRECPFGFLPPPAPQS